MKSCIIYIAAYIEHQVLGCLSDTDIEVLSIPEVVVIHQQNLFPGVILQSVHCMIIIYTSYGVALSCYITHSPDCITAMQSPL